MALLGRVYTSEELCGVPGIQDVEAHVRHGLDDYYRRKGGSLNGRYDDALKDLISTTILATIPEFDPGRGLSLSTFVYRRLQQRDVTQWLRDNVKDTRYGRRCPECDVADTVWVGNNQRQCKLCALVYDDYTEVSLTADESRYVAETIDLSRPEVLDLMNSTELTPVARKAMLQIVKPMVEQDLSEVEAIRVYSQFTGRSRVEVRRMLSDLREELECRALLAA